MLCDVCDEDGGSFACAFDVGSCASGCLCVYVYIYIYIREIYIMKISLSTGRTPYTSLTKPANNHPEHAWCEITTVALHS